MSGEDSQRRDYVGFLTIGKGGGLIPSWRLSPWKTQRPRVEGQTYTLSDDLMKYYNHWKVTEDWDLTQTAEVLTTTR